MPFILTIDEFLKKSISLSNLKYCEEEHRVLFLNEAIKNIDIKKLGISDNFTKFLKQSDYIYRFFLELASEKVEIEEIQNVDTYDFYLEHLEILKAIKKKYIEILENNSYVDKINLDKHYEINENFLDKFQDIELHFEGYFTKVEFEIVEKISQKIDTKIIFYSNSYNQKSLEVFKNLNINLKIDYKYKIDLTNKLAEVFDISPQALSVPDIDSYIGLMHTLFTLEDRYGLTIVKTENGVSMYADPRKGNDAAELSEMLNAWAEQSEKYHNGDINRDEYDKWRYNYPKYDEASGFVKVPSQNLSDAMVEAFKDKLK